MREVENIEYSKRFLKELSRLPERLVSEAEKKEKVFKENAFDHRLRIHKLHGKEKTLWVFWVDYRYRIKFLFLTEKSVLFLEIGTHKIYN